MTTLKVRSLLRPLLLSLGLLCGVGLAGCVVIMDSNSNTHVTGKNISPETYAQVKPGVTKDYVLTLFGLPTNSLSSEPGTEIWAWRYSETRNSEGNFLILFHSNNHTTTEQTVYVQFKDGVVTKIWRG